MKWSFGVVELTEQIVALGIVGASIDLLFSLVFLYTINNNNNNNDKNNTTTCYTQLCSFAVEGGSHTQKQSF